jgi:hypothetical protein
VRGFRSGIKQGLLCEPAGEDGCVSRSSLDRGFASPTDEEKSAGGSFFFGGKAIVADTTYFGAGDGHLDVTVGGNLLFELLIEARFKFADFAAAETGDMDVVAGAVGFVIVAIAAKVEEIEFVNQALALEKIDGAIDRDEMNFRVDLLGALEDLVDVEMLFGGIHDLKDDAALAGKTNPTLA